MKNIISKSFLILLIFIGSFGCQDTLEELYQDPDGFSKQQADDAGVSIIAGYFTSQLTRGFFLRGEYGAQYHNLRSGSRVMGTGVQLYYTISDYGLAYTLYDVENDWGSNSFNRTVFNKLNSDWIKQVLWAQKEFNKIPEGERQKLDILFMRLLHVLKAYAYQRSIDLYDRVPYFETGSAGALDGVKASFLGQKEIYPILLEELKEVETYLEGLELTDAEATVFSKQDVIFEGDMLQWRKYINSLRLRFAMTISERMPELTSQVLNELSSKPLFEEFNDVAGLADIAIVEPYRLQVELGITRAFRERPDESRASHKFLNEVLNCEPTEKSVVVNGQTLYYYDGDNSEEGLRNGTVDPRIAYLFSKDLMGRYIGAETAWDNGSDPNSHFNKMLRAYYINHPIMTDINVKTLRFGPESDPHEITLSDLAAADLSLREADLRKKLREYVSRYQDTRGRIGTDRSLVSEFNVRPQYNFDIRYPTMHAVEVELLLAEAAVRGFGTIKGNAEDHYRKAIELSCKYWYEINTKNTYSKNTTPAYPSTMIDSRITQDRPEMEFDASAYAANEAQRFSSLTNKEKVQAIFNQLHLHYNLFNYEVPYTNARRLINFIGKNPANPYEVFQWKERFLYNPNIQATDPEVWTEISQNNNPDIPIWFTNRDSKWKNVLE